MASTATSILQTTGLLLPVVFLSMNFVQENAKNDVDEEYMAPFLLMFVVMIGLLGVSGFSAAFSLTGIAGSTDLVNLAGAALTAFFATFSMYVYYVVKAVDSSVKKHWF